MKTRIVGVSGNLFYEYCDEVADLDFTPAFLYSLDLFTKTLRENLFVSESVINQILDSFMEKLRSFIRKRLCFNPVLPGLCNEEALKIPANIRV